MRTVELFKLKSGRVRRLVPRKLISGVNTGRVLVRGGGCGGRESSKADDEGE